MTEAFERPVEPQRFFGQLAQSDFVRKVGETFVTRAAMVVLGLATGVLVARALGPAGRGAYYVAVTVGGVLVQFGNFGLHSANTYFVSKQPKRLPELTGNSLAVAVAFTAFAAVAGFLVRLALPGAAPIHGVLGPLVLVWVALALAYLLLQNLMLGVGEVRAFNALEIAQATGSIVLMAVVIWAGLVTPVFVFAASVVATAAVTMLAFWRVRRHCDVAPRPSVFVFRQTAGYGLRAYLAALFAYLVLRADVFVIDALLGATATGHYSIAASFADKIQMLPIVIGTILFPRLAAAASRAERWRLARRTAVATLVSVALLASIAAVLVRPAIRLLYGSAFLPAADPFLLLLPGIVLWSTNVVLMNYLASEGMPPITIAIPGVAAGLNLALNLLLVESGGLRAAALASTAAYTTMFIMSVTYIAVTARREAQRSFSAGGTGS